MQKQIEQLQEQLKQQKQPPQQQQLPDEFNTNEPPVLLPNDSVWQELTELARTDPMLCELLQKSIVSVDSAVGGEDMDIEDEMEEFATNGMVFGGLLQLGRIVKEKKYSLLQKYREQQMKQLEPYQKQLSKLQQNVLESKKRKADHEGRLSTNQPSALSINMTEDMKKKMRKLEEKKKALEEEELQLYDLAVDDAETVYETAEGKMKTHFEKIAVDLEDKEVTLNECTIYKELEGESPEAAKKSWKKCLRFESMKPARLQMSTEESTNDNE